MKGLGGVEVEEGITVAAFKLPPGDREARWGGEGLRPTILAQMHTQYFFL